MPLFMVHTMGSRKRDPIFFPQGNAMPAPRRWLASCLLIFVAVLMGTNAMAGQPKTRTGEPPLTYRLEDVSIRITRSFGHGFPMQRIALSGTESATLERGKQRFPFDYPSADLLNFLNELYAIRFFDLPGDLTTKFSIFLKDDGSIGTSALRMMDAPSTSLCFTVADYEKCVTYGENGPRELEEIVERIFREADLRVKGQPSSE